VGGLIKRMARLILLVCDLSGCYGIFLSLVGLVEPSCAKHFRYLASEWINFSSQSSCYEQHDFEVPISGRSTYVVNSFLYGKVSKDIGREQRKKKYLNLGTPK